MATPGVVWIKLTRAHGPAGRWACSLGAGSHASLLRFLFLRCPAIPLFLRVARGQQGRVNLLILGGSQIEPDHGDLRHQEAGPGSSGLRRPPGGRCYLQKQYPCCADPAQF